MPKVTRRPGPGAKRLQTFLTQTRGLVGKVGWFASAHYPDGTPVAYVAAIQEYGYPEGNIPPRLGMRATAAEKQREWGALVARTSKAVLAGQMTGHAAMETIGLKAAGDIRKHITGVFQPPLKPDTVRARLAGKNQGKYVLVSIAKPLVHTGHLLATLTNTVEKKG